MITLERVSKDYSDNKTALSDINLTIKQGEMAFLTGHSGAGKSTLLKLIALIEQPSQGRILINQTDLTHVQKKDIPYIRRRIGIIFQNPCLLEDRNVFDNVALPLVMAGWQPHAVAKQVSAVLKTVSLADKGHVLPEKLSGGEQQRVGIARAIVNKPCHIIG